MRARIHDEARLLADQAVDIGRIQPDAPGRGHHVLAERRRKALRQVDLGLGAVTGVDAAVPHLALAGDLRGGQQFAVGHAAQREVPLAHALAAQAQADHVQAPLQAGHAHGRLALGGAGRRGGGRQAGAQPQVLAGQLAVEAQRRGDGLHELAGAGAGFITGRVPGRLGLQRPGPPVDPGGVFLLLRGHGAHGFQHQRPALRLRRSGAQGRAHAPGQGVVRPGRRLLRCTLLVEGPAVPAGRLGLQLQRRLLGHHAPGRRLQRSGQLGRPGLCQLAGSGLGVAGGHADDGHRAQMAVLGLGGGLALRQPAGRVVVDLTHGLGRLIPQQGRRRARGAGPVVLGRQPHLLPDLRRRELLVIEQGAGQQLATLIGITLRVPGLARGPAHVRSGLVLRQQRVTGDLAVVVHPEARELAGKGGPVAPAAQLQQPVVAQAVLHVGAAPAGKETVHLGHAGRVQARAEFPVVHPGSQRVACRGGGGFQRRQAGAVVLAQGVAGFDDGGVGGRHRRRGRGLCRRLQGRERGCSSNHERDQVQGHAPILAGSPHNGACFGQGPMGPGCMR